MRLIYFLSLMSTKGGLERTLTDKANWLVNQGHEVLIVTYESDGPVAYQLDKRVSYVDLACPYFPLYRLPFLRRIPAAMRLKRHFRETMSQVMRSFRPDVVVATIPLTEFYLHDLFRIVGKVPVIIESHLAFGFEAVARGMTERMLDVIYPPLKAIRKSSLLITLTERDALQWKKHHHHVKVVPNPMTYYPKRVSSEEKDAYRIICVGRLSPQKRFDRLVDAFSMLADKYPHWHIDLFGNTEPSGLRQLQQHIEARGLGNRFVIHQPVDDIYSEYQRSQFLVLSSDFEGFGLVIIEAMACGLPVVATNCPYGPSEIIEEGKTGLLSQMNVEDLAEKIEWMITHDKERQEMGIRAYEASARYQIEQVMPQWLAAYQSVL